MKRIRDILGFRERPGGDFRYVQDRFSDFLEILARSNRVLELIAAVRARLRGESAPDVAYAHEVVDQLSQCARGLVQEMISRYGQDYAGLADRLASIEAEAIGLLAGGDVADEVAAEAGVSGREPVGAEPSRRLLSRLCTLNPCNPEGPDFAINGCRTFRDVARFAHQKALSEAVKAAEKLSDCAMRLDSEIPLPVDVLFVDGPRLRSQRGQQIRHKDIACEPMRVFWDGLVHEGWPSQAPRATVKGFMSVLATTMSTPTSPNFAETSFAVLSPEYMMISLQMGYHVSAVEAMCSADSSRNYVRMQFSRGGAPLDRRKRRINLIEHVLDRAGFESHTNEDYLDATIIGEPSSSVLEKLNVLGRLTILTKQLDMALSSDGLAQWYADDFVKKLGLS
ncbi:MAG: hypothetical protein JXQ73_23745 [Phycisphaerae bacterium]|nr:hypothetical protein [Phycisphaerae bacterium]